MEDNAGTIGCGERILDFSYRSGEVQDLPCFSLMYFTTYTPKLSLAIYKFIYQIVSFGFFKKKK